MRFAPISVFSGLGACVLATTICAQPYPAKIVRLVVPYAAGGGVDIVGRFVATELTERLGTQFMVDNRAGGGTIIGTEFVARAAPDGYTLLVANTALTASPALHAEVPFDPVRGFTAVVQISSNYYVLVVHPSFPVHSVTELVTLAKAKPGQLNYASAGVGSAIHLAMEIFEREAGVRLVHIPYKGAAPATSDVVGGQVPIMFAATSTSVDLIRARRFRALGVGSPARSPLFPDVPTLAESGFPGFDMNGWTGIVAPAQTPRDIVLRLNREMNTILERPEAQKFFDRTGPIPAGGTPEKLAERIEKEVVLWRQILSQPKRKTGA